MKFGKKLKDLQNTKTIEPQAITGINRLVCTSKSQNVELKGTSIKILSKGRCQDPRQRCPSEFRIVSPEIESILPEFRIIPPVEKPWYGD